MNRTRKRWLVCVCIAVLSSLSFSVAFAYDPEAIYGDIYQASLYWCEEEDTSCRLGIFQDAWNDWYPASQAAFAEFEVAQATGVCFTDPGWCQVLFQEALELNLLCQYIDAAIEELM